MKNNVVSIISAASPSRSYKLQRGINGVYQKFLAGEVSISEYSDLVDQVIERHMHQNLTESWT